jgi:uncharacterized protein with HEPN domain
LRKNVIYIKHIRDAIELILEYSKDLNKQSFRTTKMIQDAVIREIEVIGEATKNLSTKYGKSILKSHGKKLRE